MDNGTTALILVAGFIALVTWLYSNQHPHDDDDDSKIEVHHDK
jgi:hypothetical protein